MPYTQVNGKVVKVPVQPGRHVVGRRGAMLGYTGRVTFHPAGVGGAPGGVVGRMVAGEHVPMMVAEGAGEVFYGYHGLHVHVVDLDGTQPLSVESDRLLVHDAALQPSVVFLGSQGGVRGAVRGMVAGQGLFTTQLAGAGGAALLAHGGVFEIAVAPGRTVAVDPQAYVAHRGALRVEVSAHVGWREAVGRGSGEAIQLKVTGTGTVFVQASEEKL